MEIITREITLFNINAGEIFKLKEGDDFYIKTSTILANKDFVQCMNLTTNNILVLDGKYIITKLNGFLTIEM
jgi:hypothetical protein